MTNYKEHTNVINDLEFIDMFFNSKEAKDIMQGVEAKLAKVDLPINVHQNSNLHMFTDNNNLRFVESGNYDFTPVRLILDRMELNVYPEEVQRLIKKIYSELTNYSYCNFELVSNSLVILSNMPKLGYADLDNILLGISQLYSKRTLANYTGLRSAVDEEDLNKALIIYDLANRVSYIISCFEVDKDLSLLKTTTKVLAQSINGAPHTLKGFCIMAKKYVQKKALEKLKDFPEAMAVIVDSLENEEHVLESLQMLEFVSSTGLVSSNLENKRNQTRVQLFNIMVETFGDVSFIKENALRVDDLIQSFDGDSSITKALQYMKGAVNKSSIKRYGKNLTLEIEPSDVFKLSHSDKIKNITISSCSDGTPIYFVANHLNLDLIAKDIITDEIILISLIQDGENISSLRNFTLDNNMKGDTESLPCIRLKFKGPEDMRYQETLEITHTTEGLKFSEDGGIKFTYKPKKSYMDEYAEAHKIIHANYKAGNYEAMKTDLAFLFAFINHIESQVIYTRKPVVASKKEDAIKARMFAINDFKTYLKKVQEHEPTFDFTKYYETIDTSKVLVEFSNSEIKGIRKLLRTILNF